MYDVRKISLTNPYGVEYALENRFDDVVNLEDSVDNSKSAKDLLKAIMKNDRRKNSTWTIERDSANETRLVSVDKLGNITYFIAKKVSATSKSTYSRDNVSLINQIKTRLAISNEFKDEQKVLDAIEDAKDAKSLLSGINKLDAYKNKWSIDKDTDRETRLKKKDALGNVRYLVAIKEAFDKIDVPDLKGVPMTPSGVGGGMPTRWIYSTYGRFLSVYGIRNKISVTFNTASSDDIKNKLSSLYKMRDNGLVDNTDLQELEERLRTMSNVNIYGNGSTEPSQVAISEIEASDEIKEGKSLSSKYDYAITVFNKDKMQKKDFKPWNILSFEDKGDKDSKGEPWARGAFGNAVVAVKNGKNGAEGLYLATKNDVNNLKNMKSEEDVLDYIKNKCKEVNVNKVDYDGIFDVKVNEEVKPTTSQAQLDHLEKIRPLSHTDEANEKRRKTIEAKKVDRLLGIKKK